MFYFHILFLFDKGVSELGCRMKFEWCKVDRMDMFGRNDQWCELWQINELSGYENDKKSKFDRYRWLLSNEIDID